MYYVYDTSGRQIAGYANRSEVETYFKTSYGDNVVFEPDSDRPERTYVYDSKDMQVGSFESAPDSNVAKAESDSKPAESETEGLGGEG